jgi:hypothetical protein
MLRWGTDGLIQRCLLRAAMLTSRPSSTSEQLGLTLPRWTLEEGHVVCRGAELESSKGNYSRSSCGSSYLRCRGNATRGISCFFVSPPPTASIHSCSAWARGWQARWRPTVRSGLTASHRGLGTGILAHEAVGSPGGSHLPLPPCDDAHTQRQETQDSRAVSGK